MSRATAFSPEGGSDVYYLAMITFDFITDEQLRMSLDADFAEVSRCYEVKAWKAVHVLVGSIVETVLMDYLISTDHKKNTGTDPINMDLGQMITACQKQGVLSEKTAQLSSAVKSYRNLIHPGRVLRLREVVDHNGATVARSLLEMIVNEIAAYKKNTYGYTAEQIVAKVERDASVMSILAHLLKDMKETEKARLLTSVLPNRYFEVDEAYRSDPFDADPSTADSQQRLCECFRSAFALSSSDTKAKAAHCFVVILMEEGEYKVLTYETAFFRADDLGVLPQNEAALVRKHLISRLGKQIDLSLIQAAQGIEKFVSVSEVNDIVDPMIRTVVNGAKQEPLRAEARTRLGEFWTNLSGDQLDRLKNRFSEWISHYEKQGKSDQAQVLMEIKESFELPF
jgi:hypothetical protein